MSDERRVTETIVAKVRRQVDAVGLVVWFDPEECYQTALAVLEGRGVPVARYVGGYFALRAELEPWLSSRERPRGVVYVPRPEAEGRYALCEACAAAAVLVPGASSVVYNTRLAVVARAAFEELLPADVLNPLLDQVQAGRIDLAELDRLAAKGVSASRSTLTLVFDTANTDEIALRFLGGDAADARLVEKGLVPALADFLRAEYGVSLSGAALSSPATLREAFARYLFGVEWTLRVEGRRDGAHVDAGVALLAMWRNRRDLLDAYVRHAEDAERHLGDPPKLPGEVLTSTETFASFDSAFVASVEDSLLGGGSPEEVIEVAGSALGRFWCFVDPARMERWSFVAGIAKVLAAADRIAKELASAPELDAVAITLGYAQGGSVGREPWCVLDAAHREMERRCHRFDFDTRGSHETLTRLVALARQRHTAIATTVAERFLDALVERGFRLPGVVSQTETFARFVRPNLDAGRTAYVLVDGLRFEMARELYQQRFPSEHAELAFTLGVLPSITSVGMAALLPGAEQGAELVAAGGDHLGLRLGGHLLKTRRDRIEYLKRALSEHVFDTRLAELLPVRKVTLEALAKARLVLVTATDELDGLGEGVNAPMARRLMDDVLAQLRRAIRVLFESGIETVIITADHGYLFGEALDAGQTIPSPGGEQADLHRRVWVGRGGATPDGCVRVPVSRTGLQSALDLVLPRGLGGFVAGGGTAYLHGGASPQELIVPVLVLRGSSSSGQGGVTTEWGLTLGSRRITTRFLSVQVVGRVTGLFRPEPRMVRVEVREARKVLSRTVAAAQGFEASTGFVRLEVTDDGRAFTPNTITLMLDETPKGKRVRLLLIDVDTDRELAALDGVEVALAGF